MSNTVRDFSQSSIEQIQSMLKNMTDEDSNLYISQLLERNYNNDLANQLGLHGYIQDALSFIQVSSEKNAHASRSFDKILEDVHNVDLQYAKEFAKTAEKIQNFNQKLLVLSEMITPSVITTDVSTFQKITENIDKIIKVSKTEINQQIILDYFSKLGLDAIPTIDMMNNPEFAERFYKANPELKMWFILGLTQEQFEVGLVNMIAKETGKTKEQLTIDAKTKLEQIIVEKFSQPTQVEGMSDEGILLLKDMEITLDESNIDLKYENGKLVAIRNQELGDGGYTVGFGVFVAYDDIEEQKRILEEYGIDVTKPNWVSIDLVLKLFKDKSPRYITSVSNFQDENGLKFTQQEFDALVIQTYNTGSLPEVVKKVLISGDITRERLENAYLEYYRSLDGWDQYGPGWTNRTIASMDMFFNGDYTKNY